MGILSSVRAARDKSLQKRTTRKRLRGSAQLHYAIAESIELLNAEHWQSVTTGASFLLSREYLTMLQRTHPANIAPRYALLAMQRDDALVPVAAIAMQLITISMAQTRPLHSETAARWRKPLRSGAAAAQQRVLVCGNFLSFGQHGVAIADGLSDAEVRQVWHGVAEVLYRVRQAEKLTGTPHFLMIKDLHTPYTAAARSLEDLSYRYIETEPDMVLSVDPAWRNYDDYLAALATKYRSNIRNGVLKPIEAAGVSVEQLTDLAAHRDELHGLYLAVQRNASFRPFELPSAYFPALAAAAGARLRCSVLRRDGRLLGFLLTLADGDTAIAYHIGFDRDAAREVPIYLRLLHAGIADAIALGCRQISYGRTALEPKAALGAKPRTFGVLVRHRQPVLNKLIKRLLTGIEHAEPPERNPFKKAP